VSKLLEVVLKTKVAELDIAVFALLMETFPAITKVLFAE
jgi:hypothetical protein